jgi:signal peptidase II
MSMAGRWTWKIALFFVVVGTIGCDRVTKHIAAATLADVPGRSFLGDTVRIGYVENHGGFLSVGDDLAPAVRAAIFTVATGAMLLVLVVFAVRLRSSGWPALGLTLFVAGGLSNWIDRVTQGSVVDFLNVGVGPVRTGVFNVADLAIMVGAIAFAWGEFSRRPSDPTTNDNGTVQHPAAADERRRPV